MRKINLRTKLWGFYIILLVFTVSGFTQDLPGQETGRQTNVIQDAGDHFSSMEDPPLIINPEPGKLGTDKDLWLQWESVTDAVYYEIEIDVTDSFNSPRFSKSNISGTRVQAKNLQYERQYYWRVRAIFTDDTGLWSETFTFTTMLPPPVRINNPDIYSLGNLSAGDIYYIDRTETLIDAPEHLRNSLWLMTGNDEKNNDTEEFITFTLDGPASIYVGYDSRATTYPTWLSSEFSQTPYTVQTTDKASPLQLWRKDVTAGVQTLGGNKYGGGDDAGSNYIVLIDIPIQAHDPIADKVGTGIKTIVSWMPRGNYVTYDIQADTSPNFINPVVDATDVADDHYMLTGLLPNTEYHWRVKAHNRYSDAAWTTTRSFTTMGTPPIQITQPNNYALAWLDTGDEYYTDRFYTIENIPPGLQGMLWLKTANDDADLATTSHITYQLSSNATVYVGFDDRAIDIPHWVKDNFTKTNTSIQVSDEAGSLNLWQQEQTVGVYTLGANMADGGHDVISQYIVFFDIPPVAAPVAAFSGSPTSGTSPLQVNFQDASTGDITTWSWDFGDGNSSSEQNPVYTYSTPGTYNVSLTVTGPGGSDTETKNQYITVTHPAPEAAFEGSPQTGYAPLNVAFTDNSTGTITTWLWEFGDGNTSTEQNPSHSYTAPGTYTVALTVTGPGGSDTEIKNMYITVTVPILEANFTADPQSGIMPLQVQFNSTSTGTITGYAWDFGDGNTSTEANPTHTYQSAGTYTVQLTVTSTSGSDTEIKNDFITVNYPPIEADFTSNLQSGTLPLQVRFTNTSTGIITGYAWDFGDGGTSTEANPIHTYQTAGFFNVQLIATGAGGSDTEIKNQYITVTYAAPEAIFTADPQSGTLPLQIQFTNASTGYITAYAWEFGDGETSTEASPMHTYQSAGTFTVQLTVTGPGGSSSLTRDNYITASAAQPVANFDADTTTGVRPFTVQFNDKSAGDIDSYAWDFGDGGTSSLQNPQHTFADTGKYTVSLNVIGPGGTSNIVKKDYITVKEQPPVADFMATPTEGTRPLTVNFTNQSSGIITHFLWNFGDGHTSSVQHPEHTYNQADSFTVTLTVTGPGGTNSKVMENYIKVGESAPVAKFGWTPDQGALPLTVQFSDSSEGVINEWLWFFGDGNTSTEQNPQYTYTTAGSYNVTLSIIGPGGNSSHTQYNAVTVSEAAPVASFGAFPTSGIVPLGVQFSDSSQGIITDWLWDFGDGSSSTQQNPIHTYQTADSFDVTLTVTGPGGTGYKTLEDYIQVQFPTGVSDLFDTSVPKQYQLYQNYPNPFNPVTNIRYALPQSGHVKLVIYNVLGKREITLVDQQQPAGNYMIKTDLSRLSSGIYFYRLQAGAFTDTRKLMLMK